MYELHHKHGVWGGAERLLENLYKYLILKRRLLLDTILNQRQIKNLTALVVLKQRPQYAAEVL